MDASKLSRYDWVVVGGMGLMLIALSFAWYRSDLPRDILSFSLNGWHFGAAVIAWLLTLLAAALVIMKGIPSLRFALPLPQGISVMALGGVAFLLVLYRLIAVPAPAQAYSRGAGIYIALLATAIVVFGGFLKNAETP